MTAGVHGLQMRAGVLYGLAAYGAWGLVPVYFKAVAAVPALEVLAHRVIWSVAILALLMAWRQQWPTAAAAVRSRRTAATLALTTLLIATNWLVFIWAVAANHVLEASLGYYINPLVNILLGFLFLRERLRLGQIVAVALAVAGVAFLVLSLRQLPAVALVLAFTFGFYGLLRKTARVDALVGLSVETTFLLPAAIAFLAYRALHGDLVFAGHSRATDLLLLCAGPITTLPLLWFTNAARRLRLTTMGFLQYLAPTGHFLLAVLAYGEPFTRTHGVTFALIWTALAIYSIDTTRAARQTRFVPPSTASDTKLRPAPAADVGT